MDANGRKWVENDLVYQIAGCAMAVMNELGHGLRKKTYERALCVEFKFQNVAYDQQHAHLPSHRGPQSGRDSQFQTFEIGMEESGLTEPNL